MSDERSPEDEQPDAEPSAPGAEGAEGDAGQIETKGSNGPVIG